MPINTPVITGYYRYTDIWFEWGEALPNPEDRTPIKASFAHDSLVHPDHPLHVDGVQGAQLYMGTFHTGESRLLFSSAQVDYIRYWLHAMKLTKEIVPLPYSDCLLTESNLKNVSPVVFKDGGSLRNAIKQISKNNKRLKGSNPVLTSRRDLFERIRGFWAAKAGVWCSLDFEGWELDHTVITELGWSLIRWENGEEVHEFGHLIVDEHQKYTNGKYVPERRKNYNFGASEVLKKPAFKSWICDLVTGMAQYGPVFLVFHDNSQDIKYLKSPAVEAPLDGMSYILPDTVPQKGIFVVDTSDLFSALEGDGSSNRNRRSLEQVCRHLSIPTDYLHNAGNDAYYTLDALKAMAAGDPIDIEREKRWPNRTGATANQGIKVQFQPYEEDSDFSDEEGIFPPVYA